jgi:hypothetical protein
LQQNNFLENASVLALKDPAKTATPQQALDEDSKLHMDASNSDQGEIDDVVRNAGNDSNTEQEAVFMENETPNLNHGVSEAVDIIAKEQSQINTLQKLKDDLMGGFQNIVGGIREAESVLAAKRKEVDQVEEAKTRALEELGSMMSEMNKEPSGQSADEGTNEETGDDILITELSSWSISNEDEESIILGTYSSDNCTEEAGMVWRNKMLKVGIEYFKGIAIVEVDSLPCGFDGKHVFKMTLSHYNDEDRRSDGRNWNKATTTTPYNFHSMCDPNCTGEKRKRKLQKCLGEYRCSNENCTYLQYYKTPNYSQYKRRPEVAPKKFFCNSCGEEMKTVPCEDENLPNSQAPRRIISICISSKVVGLYYLGNHSCRAKTKLAVVDKKLLQDSFRANPRLTALQAQRNLVIQAVHESTDGNATYDSFSDLQAIARVRRRVKRDEISDAIHLISKIDQSLNDKYLIRQLQGILYLTSDYKLSRLKEVIESKDSQTNIPCALSIDGNFSLIRNHCILAITFYDMSIARVISVGEIVIKLEDGKGGETGMAFTNSKCVRHHV